MVARDSSQAKAAIDKLVEEFNDAQDYIKSLTSVTNDGERVSAGKFSSNIEISRLEANCVKLYLVILHLTPKVAQHPTVQIWL